MTLGRCATAFLVCGWILQSTGACENEYDRGSTPSAPKDSVWEFPGSAYLAKLRDRHQGEVISVEEKLNAFQESGDFRDEANYAVALLRTGKHAEARDILIHLADEHPDEYVLAANLGTAYELTGDNEQALVWIRKGMRLNPESHNGTEWLHVKILQAKIAAANDPAKLQAVLNLDFGPHAMPETPPQLERDDEGRPLTLEAIRKALEYQLHERLFYVRPQDEVVASLLVTLGNLLALEGQREQAFHVWQLAGEYNPAGMESVKEKLMAINPYDGTAGMPPPSTARADEDEFGFPLARIAVLGTMLGVCLVGGWIMRRRQAA